MSKSERNMERRERKYRRRAERELWTTLQIMLLIAIGTGIALGVLLRSCFG